ncbi:hypothetical protein GGI25_005204 [Coemansia spiralis]|uniref:Uncharacterized protein n=2 Tax=Coemansia TaxID=4863 RepID=A0A9W8FZ02_9FUNG|nr:hypothetical protein GGI25_005204 [Coemansia spiralis]
MRSRYQDLRKCESQAALDAMWGDILVHRLTLQDYCEDFIIKRPEIANTAAADKILWKYVYYDAIIECRKRLRLHVPLHDLSHSVSSIAWSNRSFEGMTSNEGSVTRSSRTTTSTSDGILEEWRCEWWALVLSTLFNEALGYFQTLLSRIKSQLNERPALDYSLAYVKGSGYCFPPSYLIARRLYLYIGDLYRYQYMYLPLLPTYSEIGPVDTSAILTMAQLTYARAKAMHINSGRACIQRSILSAYTHSHFDALFWQMCGLCYEDSALIRTKGMINVLTQSTSNTDYKEEDPIESLVIRLAQTMLHGQPVGGSSVNGNNGEGNPESSPSSNTSQMSNNRKYRNNQPVEEIYRALLATLNDDLDEIKNCDAPLNLDADFWAREFQLSVILAALLTSTSTSISASDSGILSLGPERTTNYIIIIQHLASAQLLRQMLCLRRALDLGEDHILSTVYPLISLALWADLWRSGSHIADAFKSNYELADSLGLSTSMKALMSCLQSLIRNYSDVETDSGDANTQNLELANAVLPHDIMLMGWVSLSPIQKNLRYESIGTLPAILSSLPRNLLTCMPEQMPLKQSKAESSNGLMDMLRDTNALMRVVFARTQLLLHALTSSVPQLMLKRGTGTLGTCDELIDSEIQHSNDAADQADQVQHADGTVALANGSSKGVGCCPNSGSSSDFSAVGEKDIGGNTDEINSDIALLCIPDMQFWLDHLQMLQKMLVAKKGSVSLLADVHKRLSAQAENIGLEYKALAALKFIEGQPARYLKAGSSLLVRDSNDAFTDWEEANAYFTFAGEENDDEELPTIDDVPEEMRSLISGALYFAHVRYPQQTVLIATDSDELEFYASWFGIDCISPNAFSDVLAMD